MSPHFEVRVAESAARDIRALDSTIRERIKSKLIWLGANAEIVIHHRLGGLLSEGEGVYRLRVGDWRVFYQISNREKKIYVLGVAHRSRSY